MWKTFIQAVLKLPKVQWYVEHLLKLCAVNIKRLRTTHLFMISSTVSDLTTAVFPFALLDMRTSSHPRKLPVNEALAPFVWSMKLSRNSLRAVSTLTTSCYDFSWPRCQHTTGYVACVLNPILSDRTAVASIRHWLLLNFALCCTGNALMYTDLFSRFEHVVKWPREDTILPRHWSSGILDPVDIFLTLELYIIRGNPLSVPLHFSI